MRVKFNLFQGFASIKRGGPTFFFLLWIPTAYFTPGPSLIDGPSLIQIRKKGIDSYLLTLITSLFHMVSQK